MPLFHFQWSKQAADHNWAMLQQHQLQLGPALATQSGTPLAFGSEFRQPTLLDPLFHYHPLWPRARTSLLHGVEFPLTNLPNEQRKTELSLALRRGNHQSVKQHQAAVQTLLKREVSNGWQLPLPRHLIASLPGVTVAPLGLVTQSTINARGEIIPKHRLTHDQSFEMQPGSSVNSRVEHQHLTPCRYGTALRRFLHFIVDLRRRHPTTRILLTKLDFKAAYRRLHLAPTTAVQSAVTFDEFALVALRLTFGGAPCPSYWSDISEITCDTCNQLSRCNQWTPSQAAHLQSPHQARYVGPPKYLPTTPQHTPPSLRSSRMTPPSLNATSTTCSHVSWTTHSPFGKEPASHSLYYTYWGAPFCGMNPSLVTTSCHLTRPLLKAHPQNP